MKQLWLTLSLVFGIVFLASSQTTTKTADKTNLLLGKWQGSYQGSATGKCTLEFSKDSTGKPTGQITIQPDGGETSPPITFDSFNLEGSSLKATFTDPEGEKIEMDGKLENNQLKGTWKTASNETGSWQSDKTK